MIIKEGETVDVENLILGFSSFLHKHTQKNKIVSESPFDTDTVTFIAKGDIVLNIKCIIDETK